LKVVVKRGQQESGYHNAALMLQAFERMTAKTAQFRAMGWRQQVSGVLCLFYI
jgi:hypothetical protein